MSNKQAKQFNLCLKEFNNELLKMSSVPKLKKLISRINTLFKVNICSKILINKFVEFCMPLNEYIKSNNPVFFELLIKQEKNGEFYELMLQLHQMWGGLSKVNKNNIFRYLQILNWTSEKYLNDYLEAKK